jgi:hypothetical protein
LGVLKRRYKEAGNMSRNAVMHGEDVSPWPTEEEDEKLLPLAGPAHRLTRKSIGEGSEAVKLV